MVEDLKSDFESMFQQFYERAAYKDRLKGLTDDEIKTEIRASPQKIKNHSRKLLKYLKERG